ncbi:uncharacterized protein LOC121989508 [Zingiber officinale]|uniref:Uncharacterized protein n=1 Tax=Zingiber officinale TaxID=94328 RepID=A0A8J5GDP7_ZINOF|nr:uncharacterized protein LOC121989508 [Zingiber officinale]XP_042399533.1 uncharacterized protein LOC121989508 [Zingiber officinale]XP_042399534.1 uncharacterized protein LOC121989508 [Zingiber officinale]KAG6498107.1 hypothetical protein ZIOFF_046016 [Zingiber officinale]
MERSEPALVPQWYKLANGSSSNNALRISTSKRPGDNCTAFGLRDKLIRDQDRNLRSLSSNSSINRDRSSFVKTQTYGNFQRSRENNQEKNFDHLNRENRSSLIHNGFDYHDSSRVRAKKDYMRRSHSMVTGRQLNLPKREEFPSLQIKRRQSFSDADAELSMGPKTAVHSLQVVTPLIIGTSALAEAPVKFETNENDVASATKSTMAETLAHTPSLVGNNLQRIEELAMKKCKQLIPVTPTLPKSLNFNLSEKTKIITAKGRGGDLSSFTKVGQQMNLAGRPPSRSDITKTSQAGNFQILNREKNSILLAAKDGSSVSKVIDHAGFVPSVAVPPKTLADLKLRVDDKNGAFTQVSNGERKLLSRAQNRNDFFNLLRKKSLTTSSSISDSESIDVMENLQSNSLVNIQKHYHQGLDCSTESGNCSNEGFLSTDGTGRLYVDKEETKLCLDGTIDPEEEAFLQSLGWDKNAGEDALTQDEIDSFRKKYESQRPLKASIS